VSGSVLSRFLEEILLFFLLRSWSLSLGGKLTWRWLLFRGPLIFRIILIVKNRIFGTNIGIDINGRGLNIVLKQSDCSENFSDLVISEDLLSSFIIG